MTDLHCHILHDIDDGPAEPVRVPECAGSPWTIK
jgi:tyrosine-protein phosphatase YwqE